MNISRKLCSSGKTIAEYALILALIVLIAIPGLQIIGEQLQAFYRDREPISQADRLFSLLDGGGGNGTVVASGPVPSAAGADGLSSGGFGTSFDVKTLEESMAIDATSARGTVERASGQLMAMAQSRQLPDGTEIPEGIADLLEDLAGEGYTLADVERQALQSYDVQAFLDMKKKEGDQYRKNGEAYQQKVKDSYKNFAFKYQDVMHEVNSSKYDAYPNIEAIREVVTGYSGVISVSADQFVRQHFAKVDKRGDIKVDSGPGGGVTMGKKTEASSQLVGDTNFAS